MAKDDGRLYTKEEMSAAVQRRLAQVKQGGVNDVVVIEMLRNVLERLDRIEQEMKR